MRHRARRFAYLGTILLFGLLISCDRQISDPVSPGRVVGIPSTPTDIAAQIGDRAVALTWSIPDTANLMSYRIYMSDSSASDYQMLEEVAQASYVAGNLQNGSRYYFRVSAVNRSNFEGYRSLAISAIPNLYAVAINDGVVYTNDRNVTLTFVAPAETQYMQLSSDSSFGSAFWESFVTARAWEMPSSDGSHTVYARFRDRLDNVTSNFYFDSIILDTEARIDSIKYSPVGAPFSTGDRVHFRIYTGESDGQAEIVIGQGLAFIELYDDGGRGDNSADDGIYEADYEIGNQLDFENAEVFGNFIDRAANEAEQARSRDNISARRAPDPVSIFSITNDAGHFDNLALNWGSSTASDFAQYRVYRSISAGVDSSDYLARVISSANQTSLTDTGLAQNTRYYYRVYVLDNTALWSGSNEVYASTSPNLPPDGVIIYPIIAAPDTYDQLDISWSECDDQDFLRYELYRSDDSQIDTSDNLVFASDTEVSFTDHDLSANTLYYYRVRTLDRAGNTAWSNGVSGRTGDDEAPEPAVLVPLFPEPDSYEDINLSWSQPAIDDFQEFKIFSWREDLGRSDSVLIGVVTDLGSTTFLHHPSMPDGIDTVNYWYIIHTYDTGGNSAASNAVVGRLSDIPPDMVDGAVIPDTDFIAITWVPSEIPDFGSYRLMRDTLSSPANAALIYMSANSETASYNDGTSEEGVTYYYWIDIFDARNHSSRSFLGSGQW